MGPGCRRLAFGAIVAVLAAVTPLVVPADAAAQSLEARPWLGVALDSDGHGPGVRVGHVVRGSPAEKAGLHEGDRILRVGTAPVARGGDVVHAVATYAVGEAIHVAFSRAGSEESALVTLAPLPSQDDMLRMDLVGAFAPTWKNLEVVRGNMPPSIAALRGRVVLLDFWATWCAPCRVVVPKLDALQARYGARGLSVVGVSTEDSQDVAFFAQRMSMRYPVGVDKHAETTRSYGVVSLPTLVVIDKRGVVRSVAIGYDSSEDAHLESMVQSLLLEPAPRD
jgi:thiol-disulfide isomerase/thioredoxin